MSKKILSVLIANLFAAVPMLAQADDLKVEGTLNLGAMNVNDDTQRDISKLREYQDITSGPLLGIELSGHSRQYWFDLFGENLNRDDQYLNARGGAYGLFKYRLYSDSMKHNFLFNGITPYNSANVATFPALNLGTWNPVELGYKRRDSGGYVEFQGANPWYFRVDGNVVTTKGTKPGSSSQGTSPGSGYVDLAFPVDYETRNATVEAGYNGKTLHAALAWLTSRFDDANESFTWTNGYFGNGVDRSYLAPDNKYSRLAGNLTMRKLPANSTLALRFTSDELKSDAALGTSVLGNTSGASFSTGPQEASFAGKVENKTFTLALASAPMRNLDTRLYYNYYKRDDKSTAVTYLAAGSTGAGGPFENEGFSYKKNNLGFDAFWRLDRANRFGGGWDYLKTERTRFDFDETKDNRLFVEWKNSSLDTLAARVKYTNLSRKSNFLLGDRGTGTGDVAYWDRFITAFDVSNLDQKQWKVTLDYAPVELLDISFEGISKDNKYKDNVLGRLKDHRNEYYVTAGYGDPSAARFSVFLDREDVKYDSRHRIVPFGSTATGVYDPNSSPTSTAYNWTGTIKDKNWAAGAAVDWVATETLKLKFSAIYYKTDGSVDLALQEGVPASVVRPGPIDSWNDSKRVSLGMKGIYTMSKTVTLTAGYAYEKYEYTDAQYDGYRNTIPASSRQDSYLSNLYAYQPYSANIVYALVSWRF